MAMLAEPRQRKRYNLVPRGKALYEDESRFGTKMLEKMGWKKGQGLGAQEDGSKDFVRVRYKNDALGLGFEDRDDQWTQHEQSFNGLLSTLNNEDNGDANIEKDTPCEDEYKPRVGFGFGSQESKKLKEKISGISLEEKSKQSKARVHYKKFTKGKDLVQYSEKDLANIFGKKSLDEQNDFFQMINSGVTVNGFGITENNVTSNEIELEDNNKKKKKAKKDVVDVQEDIEKVQQSTSQVIYSNVSINDYFKKKMDELRNKKNGLNIQDDIATEAGDEVKTEQPIKKKKKGKKDSKDREKDGLQESAEKMSKKRKHVIEQESVDNIKSEVQVEKKSKKREKDKTADHSLDERDETLGVRNEKKSKKCDAEESTELIEGSKKRKDKSKSKNKIETDAVNETVIKKRKRDKSQMDTDLSSILMEEPHCTIDLTQEPISKKKKKPITQDTTEITKFYNNVIDASQNAESQTIKDQKQQRNNPDKESGTLETTNAENLTKTSSNKKRSKRKNVSSTAKNIFVTDVDFQVIDLDEIKKQFHAFNIYPISTFCAEKFRNVNTNNFKGSGLMQLEGYGLGPDLQLNVHPSKYDEERITNLWKGVLNKYCELGKPKATYRNYIKEFSRARKAKSKFPKLNVKTFKRKNIFQLL